ncbi:methyltransferase [Legionella sp. CNM-1927-20]|uniref:methyltransferase n=1 Tax=Legionella sp. CNM-1927-20 TaxID=3422221 RepID=UPI00403A8BFE
MLIILTSLIVLIVISLSLLLLYQNKPDKKIKKWQRSLQLNIHQPIFNKLYADINGFALSKAARVNQDAIEYTYGEIEFESFIALLSLCKPQSNTVFYDLGSGTGKAVIACAMVFDICKSYGIELFLPLHKCAQKQLQCLAQIEIYQEKAKKIILKHENFLKSSILDGTIIFINATTFIAELWEQISKHVEQVKPGTLIISTSKALTSKHFIVTRIVPLKVSWGVVNAYIQQRI